MNYLKQGLFIFLCLLFIVACTVQTKTEPINVKSEALIVNDSQEMNNLIKQHNSEIEKREQIIIDLQKELSQLYKEKKNQSMQQLPKREEKSTVDELAINLYEHSAGVYMNNLHSVNTPLHITKVVANHIEYYYYEPLLTTDLAAYTNTIEDYKQFGKINTPYILLEFISPIAITLRQGSINYDMNAEQLLLIIEDNEKPVFIIKTENGYVGYKIFVTDAYKYDFNIMYKDIIDSYDDLTNYFF